MLQVTVDDIGVDEGIDAAAVDLIESGLVRSVSLLVNYPRAEIIAPRLVQLEASVGIHLNISSGEPVLVKPSSLTTEGRFISPRTGLVPGAPFECAIQCYIRGHVDKAIRQRDLIGEVEAQWDKFLGLVGRLPDFVSVHHDLDRSGVVEEALASRFADRPGRRRRLVTGALVEYQSFFAVQAEPPDAYGARVSELLEGWLADDEPRLAVFHPSKRLPSVAFTVYAAGRTVEYRALMSRQIAELLRRAHGEIGQG